MLWSSLLYSSSLSVYISYLTLLFVNCQLMFVCEPTGSIYHALGSTALRFLFFLGGGYFVVFIFKLYLSVGVKMWFWLRFLVTLKCCVRPFGPPVNAWTIFFLEVPLTAHKNSHRRMFACSDLKIALP